MRVREFALLGAALLVLAACQETVRPQAVQLRPAADAAEEPAAGLLAAARPAPEAVAGRWRGATTLGDFIEVELLNVDETGARVNHLLGPQGPLVFGQATWQGGSLVMTVDQGRFAYTPAAGALAYEGPSAQGPQTTATLTRP